MIKRNKEIDKEGVNEIIHLSKNLLRVFYIITIVGIIILSLLALKQIEFENFLMGILKVLSPLFIGFIIAWLFYPLQKKLVDKKVNRILSALIIFILIVGVIFAFVYLFIPVLYKQVNDLISTLPTILENITNVISDAFEKVEINGIDMNSIKDKILETGSNFAIEFTSSLPNKIASVVKGLFSTLGTLVISLVVGIYMLIDFDNIKNGCYKLFPSKDRDVFIELINNIGLNARRVVNGTLLVAFMVFVCDTIGFMLVGLKASVLFGLFCGLTDLIPYIGPYIGGAAAVIVGFTQGPVVGIATLIIAAVVQLLESYILQPVVMSKAMHLHPVTIIVGLLLFAHFFGIVGMVVATPCMAILKEIFIFIKNRKLSKDKAN